MKNKLRKFAGLAYRIATPIIDPINFLFFIPRYFSFWSDFIEYSKKSNQRLTLIDLHPIINDKTSTTKIDSQYFYQGLWAFEKIYKSRVSEHVDIGSQTNLISFLTVITHVKFVDIRPLEVSLDNLTSIKGSILDLPFSDSSIGSLSCLHVAEHIGLGRYGDSIDPLGTEKACREISRVMATQGDLYFSIPIGKPRVCFNAHRIHSIKQILDLFNEFELKELIVIDDNNKLIKNPDIHKFDDAIYSGGLFHLKKVKK